MPGSDSALSYVDQLRRALLRLHKALLDDERVSYERVYGRIASNGEFLQLVLGHAWFAWLRPLSQLVAQLDELGDEDESSGGADTTTLIASVRTLLTPLEEGTGFGKHYYDALHRTPDVGLAHAAVRALLR
ncbi:MAG: hypothetical protein L0H94_09255 [Nitrospira sp.]|nr:hypothetical protein [Nitrospira sp.]